MASNEKITNQAVVASSEYQDPTPRKVLTKSDLNLMVWRSLLLQASFNYERMQGGGWTYGLIPGLKKIHTNDHDLSNALTDHMQFFNTHPMLVTVIQGIILAMEENKESRDTIRGIKVALMGPLGGIGDAMIWLTLLPITGGIGAALASGGSILGPILFLILFNVVHFALRFGLMNYGYTTGTKAVATMREKTKKISRAASIVGLTVIGALVATYIGFKLNINVDVGGMKFNVQENIIDQLMPQFLPLVFTFFCYWLLKKRVSPIWLIVLCIAIGIVFGLLGWI